MLEQTDGHMKAIASALDDVLNGAERPKQLGFVVLIFPRGGPDGGRANYISNCERKDVIAALKEVTARLEGSPYVEGRA